MVPKGQTSSLYVTLGFSATLVGGWFVEHRTSIRISSGILFIVMGLMLTGLFQLKWLYKDRRWTGTERKSGSYAGSFILGLGFAAGWTPCIGPILSSIIGLAAAEPANGLWYMFVYVAGFSIPFFLFAYFFTVFKRIHAYASFLTKIGGGVLVIAGLLLITNKLAVLSVYLNDLFDFTGYI